ncbi:MAG: dTDP-4-amino-4,6-dideoxygalactose transaminase [Candidatus Sericytochromatia bacterium]|nr:dTDP-4-amino-4,6-dideoxygalactose transaminase [Candidatus Sericytochromatia bacterium]
MTRIPFNRPYTTGREIEYIQEAIANGHLSGNGPFTKRVEGWFEAFLSAPRVLLTHSCTAALEMCAILADLQPGDEVIMPSYTFVSTANAFVLRGAVPVFVDIRPDTLNLDENLIEAAITPRTRAIVVVHYAGVACQMDVIRDIADRHQLLLIEDAAQALHAFFQDKPLGSWGHLAAFSFHETKNIQAGEGGALVINDPRFVERAEIIREKGTDRSRFFKGLVDKYTWVDVGSSYLPSELNAAFLWAQLEEAEHLTQFRINLWNHYQDALHPFSITQGVQLPSPPETCRHNAHIFWILLRDARQRDDLLTTLASEQVQAVFHYVPLHDSKAGRRLARTHGDLHVTESISPRLLRLPLWAGMEASQPRVIRVIQASIA